MTHIVFAGGSSGGHLFPGLAVAEELAVALPGVQVTFAGSGRALEQKHVTLAGYQYLSIPCRPMPKRAWETVRFLSDNFAGLLASRWFIRERDVALVVGLGSYASVPMVRAAMSHRLPTVLLDSNAIPGRATRWLAPNATMICAAFPQIEQHLHVGARLRISGNPVRKAFLRSRRPPSAAEAWPNESRRRQLLILGGSQGATALNEHLPRAVYKLGAALEGWQVTHQTGAGQVQATQELYHKLGRDALVVSFIDNLASVLRATDLVVCRAGGSTLAELAFAAPPAVMIPWPDATDDHQRANAQVYAAAGACRLIEERDPAERFDDRLVRALGPLLSDESARLQLSAKLEKFARPNAARDVARTISGLVQMTRLQAA